MPFTQLKFGPSVVGVSSLPPRVRVAYTGEVFASGARRAIINVYSVTLRSASNYSTPPVIVREHSVDVSSSGRHSIWPQLIAVDGLAGSDRRVDSPAVLRWTEVDGDTIREKAQVVYSGLVGPVTTIAEWSMATTFPGLDCLSARNPLCFNGDYKYGAFYLKTGSTLRFFVPWTGGGTDPATNTPIGFHAASGAFLDVTP
jgi:hypothetical protein